MRSVAMASAGALVLAVGLASQAVAGTTELVAAPGEVWSDPRLYIGVPSGGISGDGRLVAFGVTGCNSRAGCGSAGFVRDRQRGEYITACGDIEDWAEAISRDGRFVACKGYPANLFDLRNGSHFYGGDHSVVSVRDMALARSYRADRSSDGTPGDGDSYGTAISGGGRFVAFVSHATNLVPGDTNGKADVFLRDRRLRNTERVSVATGGMQANGDSGIVPDPHVGTLRTGAFVSDDGSVVAFTSVATNLVRGDAERRRDAFVRDRKAGTTERITVRRGGGGRGANGESMVTSLSPDGRYVVFQSEASDLVAGDGNEVQDVFVHDQHTRTTERVSVSTKGVGGNKPSHDGLISADERVVAFVPHADNLVPHDRDGTADVLAHVR